MELYDGNQVTVLIAFLFFYLKKPKNQWWNFLKRFNRLFLDFFFLKLSRTFRSFELLTFWVKVILFANCSLLLRTSFINWFVKKGVIGSAPPRFKEILSAINWLLDINVQKRRIELKSFIFALVADDLLMESFVYSIFLYSDDALMMPSEDSN